MRQTHRQEIRVAGMSEPISHFTHVVRAGNIVFVSGCVATDENGKTVGGSDIVAQTRQVHENIKRCLAAAGATFADVCKVTVFLRNVADREKVNTVRKEYFGAHRPASTLIEISRLVRDDLLIEIEATAVVADNGKNGNAKSGNAKIANAKTANAKTENAETGRAEPRASRTGHLRSKPASRTPLQKRR
jgi:2-iminobutanoate/2-iminopropanoate deaminase